MHLRQFQNFKCSKGKEHNEPLRFDHFRLLKVQFHLKQFFLQKTTKFPSPSALGNMTKYTYVSDIHMNLISITKTFLNSEKYFRNNDQKTMKKNILIKPFLLGIFVKIFRVIMTVLFSRADVNAVIYSKLYFI